MAVIALEWTALVAGRKQHDNTEARLPLVLGVPDISSRISPTTVNVRVYAAYRTGSNFSNTSKKVRAIPAPTFLTVALIMRSWLCRHYLIRNRANYIVYGTHEWE